MYRKRKIEQIIKEGYDMLYKKATPPITNFSKKYLCGEPCKNNAKNIHFYKHFLSKKDFIKTVNNLLKKHKLSKYEKESISQALYLGATPVSTKK